ncbi:MAG TPA: NAD-binding protein [Stellaceae bacterium]|nr:NAD-binding protein [Stellaceae bacterium]
MNDSAPRRDAPAMIVVGGDALAFATAREISQMQGHRVTVLWREDAEVARSVAAIGARFVAGRPESLEALERAGVGEAATILALSPDDQLNLRTALRARDANPKIRIVLRQFNRTLARKIEQNLPDCSVVSLAWQSAATYAAAALDPSCFHGLQFPEPDGPLTGFAARTAEAAGLAGLSIAEAEAATGLRVVALDGRTALPRDERIPAGARLVLFGTVANLVAAQPRRPAPARGGWRARPMLPRGTWRRIDPIFAVFGLAGIALFGLGTWHFRSSLGSDWLTAAYFVLATMTTTGYGDITPNHANAGDVLTAMGLMLSGVLLTGIFIAFAASLLTQARWVRMQGLRPIHRRGHIVVCGAGSIGSGVIDLLLGFGRPLVVIERHPDSAMIERARDQGFDLLTGDASRDDTLNLCNLAAAHSLIALTNVDTLNLEIALGARVRNPSMPIVLRIAEASFAASIARHFDFETTFSAAALAAPTCAGLSRQPGARGRLELGGQEYGIRELVLGGGAEPPRGAIALAAARGAGLELIGDFAEAAPGEPVLTMVPLAQSAEARPSLARLAGN